MDNFLINCDPNVTYPLGIRVKPSSSRTEPIMPDDILNLKIDLGRTQDVNEFLAVV
jgi:hypothetical protein